MKKIAKIVGTGLLGLSLIGTSFAGIRDGATQVTSGSNPVIASDISMNPQSNAQLVTMHQYQELSPTAEADAQKTSLWSGVINYDAIHLSSDPDSSNPVPENRVHYLDDAQKINKLGAYPHIAFAGYDKDGHKLVVATFGGNMSYGEESKTNVPLYAMVGVVNGTNIQWDNNSLIQFETGDVYSTNVAWAGGLVVGLVHSFHNYENSSMENWVQAYKIQYNPESNSYKLVPKGDNSRLEVSVNPDISIKVNVYDATIYADHYGKPDEHRIILLGQGESGTRRLYVLTFDFVSNTWKKVYDVGFDDKYVGGGNFTDNEGETVNYHGMAIGSDKDGNPNTIYILRTNTIYGERLAYVHENVYIDRIPVSNEGLPLTDKADFPEVGSYRIDYTSNFVYGNMSIATLKNVNDERLADEKTYSGVVLGIMYNAHSSESGEPIYFTSVEAQKM